MIDTLAIKKYYLRYWVDRSQAARKAAEELANKEVALSLNDRYKEEGLVFTLDGHKVEFKGEYNLFTYDEAMECFGKPDEGGWRLPTKKELGTLCNYSYKFDDNSSQGIFDYRLYLPVAGYRYCDGDVGDVGSYGCYWSSTPDGLGSAWYLNLDSDQVDMYSVYRCNGQSVRLVRDVK